MNKKMNKKMLMGILACLFLLSVIASNVYANFTSVSESDSIQEQMQQSGRGMQHGGGMMQRGGGMSGAQNMSSEPLEIVTSSAVNTAADLEADMGSAVHITMNASENKVKIEEAGTYIISGTANEGSITVKKGTTDVVLVLEDLDLTSSDGAALSLNKETEVKVIISGTVTLTDAENPKDEYSSDQDIADAYDGAAIKAKAGSMVYITGDGTLNIIGKAKNGIKAGDDSALTIDGPEVRITAVNDGINVNNDLVILSGSIAVSSGDDALHADKILTIGNSDGSGPVIYIAQAGEGIEATIVNIFGGDMTVNASDDAINATNKDDVYTGSINMTGGNVTINGLGDGFDSNGNINLIAGSASINVQNRGGEAGVDYDGAYYISEAFQMNNTGGVSGPDNMGGGFGRGQGGWGRP